MLIKAITGCIVLASAIHSKTKHTPSTKDTSSKTHTVAIPRITNSSNQARQEFVNMQQHIPGLGFLP